MRLLSIDFPGERNEFEGKTYFITILCGGEILDNKQIIFNKTFFFLITIKLYNIVMMRLQVSEEGEEEFERKRECIIINYSFAFTHLQLTLDHCHTPVIDRFRLEKRNVSN